MKRVLAWCRARLYVAGVEPQRPVRCPRCRTPVRWQNNPHRPFCSDRCRLADLGNWADERYRIPGEPIGDDDTSDETPN